MINKHEKKKLSETDDASRQVATPRNAHDERRSAGHNE